MCVCVCVSVAFYSAESRLVKRLTRETSVGCNCPNVGRLFFCYLFFFLLCTGSTDRPDNEDGADSHIVPVGGDSTGWPIVAVGSCSSLFDCVFVSLLALFISPLFQRSYGRVRPGRSPWIL